MKKLLKLILAVSMLLLFACSNNNGNTENEEVSFDSLKIALMPHASYQEILNRQEELAQSLKECFELYGIHAEEVLLDIAVSNDDALSGVKDGRYDLAMIPAFRYCRYSDSLTALGIFSFSKPLADENDFSIAVNDESVISVQKLLCVNINSAEGRRIADEGFTESDLSGLSWAISSLDSMELAAFRYFLAGKGGVRHQAGR